MPVFELSDDIVFPHPQWAEDGLLAAGGDLRTERLLLAYRSGIFPWYSEGEPILWWSPNPRGVLYPNEFHISRRLARTLRQGRFEVTFDRAFPEVMRGCAEAPRPGQDGTWIVPEMVDAYTNLFHEGYAHSVESWRGGELVGGVYGVSLGACFFGESMFARESDASKVAFATLITQLRQWSFQLIDCQMRTGHLARLGARTIGRARFLQELEAALKVPTRKGPWTGPERAAAHDGGL